MSKCEGVEENYKFKAGLSFPGSGIMDVDHQT